MRLAANGGRLAVNGRATGPRPAGLWAGRTGWMRPGWAVRVARAAGQTAGGAR
jgi:hypothetical protein